MKKMVFGVMLFFLGFALAMTIYINSLMNPWNYDGIEGLLGSLLGTGTLVPFVAACSLGIVGLAICYYEAYLRK